MNQALAAILGILALVMIPAMTLAKSDKGGSGDGKGSTNTPSPNQSAYEHADENAKFQRDTDDMGKHEGESQNQDKAKDKDKAKIKGDAKGSAKGKGKSTDKAKDKGKNKGTADKGKRGQTDADKLLEQVSKPKEAKAK